VVRQENVTNHPVFGSVSALVSSVWVLVIAIVAGNRVYVSCAKAAVDVRCVVGKVHVTLVVESAAKCVKIPEIVYVVRALVSVYIAIAQVFVRTAAD
jgi:hypothetical protein